MIGRKVNCYEASGCYKGKVTKVAGEFVTVFCADGKTRSYHRKQVRLVKETPSFRPKGMKFYAVIFDRTPGPRTVSNVAPIGQLFAYSPEGYSKACRRMSLMRDSNLPKYMKPVSAAIGHVQVLGLRRLGSMGGV